MVAADLPSGAFWQETASIFTSDPDVMIEFDKDLHDMPWSVWRDGAGITCADIDDASTSSASSNRCTLFA